MSYSPPWWLKNGHLQSIYPSVFRRLNDDFLSRHRLETDDGDFLEFDVAVAGNRRALVISHGLEGHSRRPYMLGMARAAFDAGWDVYLWNFRSCGGNPNRLLTSYHSGQTKDLSAVVNHTVAQGYAEVSLVGFSIGGNKTLIYLGDASVQKTSQLNAAVAFSVPLDLFSTSVQLARKKNRLYMKNFLGSFKQKLLEKQRLFPGDVNLNGFEQIKNFHQFDQRYTAPMNGFSSAEEYWEKSSSKQFLATIRHPTLLISALDDPFLTPECFPFHAVERNDSLELETPKYGGHVGFMAFSSEKQYWSERRAIQYLNSKSLLG